MSNSVTFPIILLVRRIGDAVRHGSQAKVRHGYGTTKGTIKAAAHDPRLWPKQEAALQPGGERSGREIKTSNLPLVHPRTACSLFQVAPWPSLCQPTKPRANIINRYAPILASTFLSFFAVDCVAKPLK